MYQEGIDIESHNSPETGHLECGAPHRTSKNIRNYSLPLHISCVHTKHLGRIISGLGFGLVGVNTDWWVISYLAMSA